MARIRTIKPETFTSDDVNELPVAARWTFVGLWCYVDDAARGRADARLVKAAVWPIDDTVSSADVAQHLDEMEKRRMICRYEVDGITYMHVVNFGQHQRVNRPSESKVPPCPRDIHGGLPDPPPIDPDHIPDDSVRTQGDVSEDSPLARRPARAPEVEQGTGNREQGTGIPPSAGTLALVPRPAAPGPGDTAQALVGEWLEHCRKRPPGTVIGQVGKQLKAMLAEGIDHADVRTGLAEWWRKGLHPSALPSVVNELMNASPARASPQQATSDQRFAQAKEAGRIAQAKFDAAQRAKGVTA